MVTAGLLFVQQAIVVLQPVHNYPKATNITAIEKPVPAMHTNADNSIKTLGKHNRNMSVVAKNSNTHVLYTWCWDEVGIS